MVGLELLYAMMIYLCEEGTSYLVLNPYLVRFIFRARSREGGVWGFFFLFFFFLFWRERGVRNEMRLCIMVL